AQAADLLRNLLSLFPGNPILERDLASALGGLPPAPAEVAPLRVEEAAPDVPAPAVVAHGAASSRFRRAAICGTVGLVLVAAAGAAWKLSRNSVIPPKSPAHPAAVHASVEAPPLVPQPAAVPEPTVQAPAPQAVAVERAPAKAKERAAGRTASFR